MYKVAFVDLNADNSPEAVVYVEGREWCGSGGCNTLILRRDGSSYRIVTATTITRPPIRVLQSRSHGWRDLSIWVEGGGNPRGYEALLPFDGKTYPSNPSVSPARPIRGNIPGEVLISRESADARLYK
jgi:hypothetical protein